MIFDIRRAAWFLIGGQEISEEFETYSAGHCINLHEIPNLRSQNGFPEAI